MEDGGPVSPVESLLGVLGRKGMPGYSSSGNMPVDTQALMEYVNAAQGRITGGMSPRDAANANAFMMQQQMDYGLPATAQALYGVEQQMQTGGETLYNGAANLTTEDVLAKIQAEAAKQGMNPAELLKAITSGNAGAAKLNLLGTGLGAAGNFITTLGEGDDARPDDPYSFTDGLGSVLSGAGQGAMFGPVGMAVGAALGLGKSIFTHHKDKNEFIQAQEEAKEERARMNEDQARNFSEQVLSTYNQEGMAGGSYYTHGGPIDYETEKNEVILAGPNDPPIAIGQGTYKQKSTNLYEGKGPSHKMGGIPTKGATQPFVDQMGRQQDSPYVFSDAKEMRFDASSILSMIS
tara:strand:- start:956 stop:2002 length:1047 start_codon:yes stop_codon:yes gene_type:complete